MTSTEQTILNNGIAIGMASKGIVKVESKNESVSPYRKYNILKGQYHLLARGTTYKTFTLIQSSPYA